MFLSTWNYLYISSEIHIKLHYTNNVAQNVLCFPTTFTEESNDMRKLAIEIDKKLAITERAYAE